MPTADPVQFGGPFRGFVCSQPKHRVALDAMTGDSQDCLMDPVSGSILRRSGQQILGDSITSHETNGLLPWSGFARSRRAFPLRSPSLSDGYETYAALYTRETQPNGGPLPTNEDGYFGTVYIRNTNTGASITNYTLGAEFSATHYPTSGGTYNTVHHMVWVPLWVRSGEGGYNRGAFEYARRMIAAGSRNVLDTRDKLYLPNLMGTPAWWGKRFNGETASGSETNRLMPAGPIPSAASPVAGSPGAVTVGGNDAVWTDGDTYAIAVIGRKKDGSYTHPTIPRMPNSNMPNGLSLVVVGTLGGTTKYANMTYAIPIFPDDIEARIILRTDKVHRTAATDAITIDVTTLKICGVLRNNTQLQFVDTNGNDVGLLDEPNVVRFDHIQPRPSRYWGTGDQRGMLGYTFNGQQAFVIAPMGATSDWQVGIQGLNAADESNIIYGNQVMLVRITETEFQVHRYEVAGPTLYSLAITLSGKSIQDVVDIINITTCAVNQGQWRAQIAPGLDPTTAATALCPTTWARTSNGTSGNNFITANTPGDFAAIPLGYKVTGSGSIPANTVVIRKEGDKIYLGNESGTSVNLTGNIAAVSLTFYADCGDGTAYHATNRGYIRAFGPSYYFMAYLRRTALAGYETPDKLSTYFTISSPGAAASGVSLAPEAFVAGNKRGTEAKLGIHMGFVDIEGAAVVGFSKGLKFFINTRGVNSGEDFDYRMMTIDDAGGVIDDKCFFGGRGWALFGNEEGIFAIDKGRQPKKISGDIHNYDKQSLSVLAFELNACRDAVDSDQDTGALHGSVTGSIIHISYRVTGVSYAQRRITYHFAPGVEAGGVEELFEFGGERPRPYGWGAPCLQPLSCITEVSTRLGRYRIATIDTNAGLKDGRIDRIDDSTMTTDNGAPYDAIAYLAAIPPPWFKRWNALRAEAVHTSPEGASPTFRYHRLMDRSSYTDRLLETIGEDPARELIEFSTEARSNGDAAEPAWLFSDIEGEALYGIAVEANLAEV